MLVYSVHSLASSECWYFKRIHNTVWFLLLFSLLTIDGIKKECSWDGDSVFSVCMFFYKYVDYWTLAPVKRNIHKNFTTFKWRYTASCLLWNITGFSEIVIHSILNGYIYLLNLLTYKFVRFVMKWHLTWITFSFHKKVKEGEKKIKVTTGERLNLRATCQLLGWLWVLFGSELMQVLKT